MWGPVEYVLQGCYTVMRFKSCVFLSAALACGVFLLNGRLLHAQKAKASSEDSATASDPSSDQEVDPLKRPRSDKERFAAQKAVRQELKGAYKTWLDQDVVYIISDEERKAFKNLSNDEEREAFI